MTMNSFNNFHPLALHEGFQKYISVLEVLRLYGTDVGVQIPSGGQACIMLMAPNDNFRKMDTETFKVFPAGTWDVGTICTAVMDLTRYWSGTKATKVTGMVFPCVMPHLAERYMYWSQYIPEDGERSGPVISDIGLSEFSASIGDGNRLPRSRSNEKTPS